MPTSSDPRFNSAKYFKSSSRIFWLSANKRFLIEKFLQGNIDRILTAWNWSRCSLDAGQKWYMNIYIHMYCILQELKRWNNSLFINQINIGFLLNYRLQIWISIFNLKITSFNSITLKNILLQKEFSHKFWMKYISIFNKVLPSTKWREKMKISKKLTSYKIHKIEYQKIWSCEKLN